MHRVRGAPAERAGGGVTMDLRLQAVIAEILDLEPAAVRDDMRREDTDAWDSLNHLRLVTAVESEFGVRLSLDEIGSVDSPRALEDLIRAHGGLHD